MIGPAVTNSGSKCKPQPYYADDAVTLHHGDCLEVLRTLPDASVDAVVTDPPYGLEFMGKDWDSFKAPTGGAGFESDGMGKGFTALPNFGGNPNPTCRNCRGMKRGQDRAGFTRCRCDAPDFPNVGLKQSRAFGQWCEQWAVECLRVLKPGGHLLAFGGTRTVHRLTAGIEDAGFEIRDGIDWLYASGFPKSLDVSKAIDKTGGESPEAQAKVLREARLRAHMTVEQVANAVGCKPTSIRNWEEGRARAAGKAVEYITPSPQYRDRLADLLGYTADERRVVGALDDRRGDGTVIGLGHSGVQYGDPATEAAQRWSGWGTALKPAREPIVMARKPLAGTVAANVLAYGTGALNIDATRVPGRERTDYGLATATRTHGSTYGAPSASADFDSSKGRWPSNVVLSHAPDCEPDEYECVTGCPVAEMGEPSRFFPVFRFEAKAPTSERPRVNGEAHPTVKPLDLMRWLVRLVTPDGGVVLDLFAGSGTTAEACVLEGFRCTAIERDATYLPLITARLTKPLQPALDFGDAA